MGPTLQRDGTWVYPCIGAALSMNGLDDIGVYIARHQNTVSQYIATCPIMDLYLVENRNPGMRLSRRWWEQPAMDIRVIIVGHVAAEGGGGEGRVQMNRRDNEMDIRIGKDGGRDQIGE